MKQKKDQQYEMHQKHNEETQKNQDMNWKDDQKQQMEKCAHKR